MKKCLVVVVLLISLVANTYAQNELTDIQKQAIKDAKADMDRHRWLVVGGGIGVFGFCTGLVAGFAFSEESTVGLGGYGSPVLNLPYAIGCSLLIDVLSPIIISQQKPTVPSHRLLGKSSEQVDAYSETYKKTVRKQRFLWSAIGSGTSGVGLTGMMIIEEIQN